MKFRFFLTATISVFLTAGTPVYSQDRITADLSGQGWNLWYDKNAEWQNDELFLSPDIEKLPVHQPSGGWSALDNTSGKTSVSVPGTVEEYLQKTPGPDGDLTGVSWWFRQVTIPESASGRKIFLQFESVRQRAEIFINRKLVGYDIIGNTPFQVDISKYVNPGETVQLAVRITDPGGNFIWKDGLTMQWGKYKLPVSHGFGGITGRVKLVSCDPVYIDNLYVQNQPSITEARVYATVINSTGKAAKMDFVLNVSEAGNANSPLITLKTDNVELRPGENTVPFKISAPEAKVWDIDHPNLYTCKVSMGNNKVTDSDSETFGFRWFGISGVGENAEFKLNGRRIVLRTSISWGFWPVNGIFPTEAWAEKQVRTAKSMGLNMLNFHRCIGQPVVLEKADELGLMYYEEPGNYKAGDNEPFARAILREKWLRMVKRDRNHPSIVIYSMINEYGGGSNEILALHKKDIQDAHAIDPSRIITHTSAWAKGKDVEDQSKMHMRPFDDKVYMNGWYDFHHAGGPATWNQSLYRNPKDYHNNTDNAREIVFWGEEGAISTPPRLQKIKEELDTLSHPGWDGQMYLDWYKEFDRFLNTKKLKSSFPSVDALTLAMGAITMQHQGRRIENIRINNFTDGYAINGWEAEIIENHSGVVDCFRNPKGDPGITAYYNQPLFVAVKVRNQVLSSDSSIIADFFIVNEKDLKGDFELRIQLKNPSGDQLFSENVPVHIAGGVVYGQKLAEGIKIPVSDKTGMLKLETEITDPSGSVKARGREEVLSVNWKDQQLIGTGYIWEDGSKLHDFFLKQKNMDVKPYSNQVEKPDWIVVARPPQGSVFKVVPEEVFKDGLNVTFFSDQKMTRTIASRHDNLVNLSVADGATPDSAVSQTENYAVRWEGALTPTVSGIYEFNVHSSGAFSMFFNGKPMLSLDNAKGGNDNRFRIDLQAGQPVNLQIDFHQVKGSSNFKVLWSAPEMNSPDPLRLLELVRNGAKLVILNYTDNWGEFLKKHAGVKYNGSFKVGTSWLGGVHFVKKHPLFEGLPVDCGMDWPYQAVVRNGNDRYGMLFEGEEIVAGAYHSYPMQMGTAVGIIPYGKGKIIISTLDIYDQILSRDSAAEVARKLICNYLAF